MNLIKSFLILIGIIIHNFLFSQYYMPDSIALSLTDLKFSTDDELVISLVNNLDKDEDKYRAIFRYLTFKIKYKEATTQIKGLNKKNNYGNCVAVSEKYQILCQIANLKCDLVSGYANNGDRIDKHQWNLIYIGNKPYIVDVTWSLYPFKDFNKNFVYFKANDALLRYTHFSTHLYFRKYRLSYGKFIKGVHVGSGFIENYQYFLSFESKYKVSSNCLEIIADTDFLKKTNIGLQYKQDLFFPEIKEMNSGYSKLIFDIDKIPKNSMFIIFLNKKDKNIKMRDIVFKYFKGR